SQENVRKYDVGRLVRIERKDLFTLDLSEMDVITLYLLPRMNERLLPQLAKLKPGARVVCHANPIPGVHPARVVTVVSTEDGLPHKVYLYVAPLKKGDARKGASCFSEAGTPRTACPTRLTAASSSRPLARPAVCASSRSTPPRATRASTWPRPSSSRACWW